jgi:hypothetical protein
VSSSLNVSTKKLYIYINTLSQKNYLEIIKNLETF